MRSIVSALLGLAVVVVLLSAFGDYRARGVTRTSAQRSSDGSSRLDTKLGDPRGELVRNRASVHGKHGSDRPVRPQPAVTAQEALVGVRLAPELSVLAPIYAYWASEPVDAVTTTSEQTRIGELLARHDVQPTSMKMACSRKMCRSQMIFPDMATAGRMHTLERRSDRKIYSNAEAGANDFRVALYWTLTDEATAEAPDPDPEEADPPNLDESDEPEEAAALGG